MRRLASHLLRSRLLQFLVLGAAIFALAPRGTSSARISLKRDYLEALETAEASRVAGAQRAEVDRRAIEDEVLYREALRLGLDQGDPLVRGHLIQKMLLLAEDLGGATRTPTDAELRAFFAQHPERWQQPAAWRFLHVFASTPEALAALELDPAATVPPDVGEAFPLSRDVRKTEPELAADFGPELARALSTLAPGAWSAPLQSRFGWHRVKVLEHLPAHLPVFDEVRGRVSLDCAVDRRRAAVQSFLTRALERYEVDVDGAPAPAFVPEGRLGSRSEPSAEDG
jgi:peptidyl-prolyl cis-trans isomerase C